MGSGASRCDIEMPFWSANKDVDYKAKLEHKMCVAKETPESTFDLADCNLGEVPHGIFSMCRVFRKEILLLQDNHLHSLHSGGPLRDLAMLKVLNLNNNKFTTLPEDIENLTNLQVLSLQDNRLKKLPSSFENLRKLHTLNLKGNKLRELPIVLCKLPNIQSLNICSNEKLKSLPKELCNIVCLEKLELDYDNFTYPPPEICFEGTESIMKFLCIETGKDYIPASEYVQQQTDVMDTDDARKSSLPDDSSWTEPNLPASYQLYQRTKEQRRQELVQMEEAMKDSQELQAQVAADALVRRQKLLEDVVQEQERLQDEIVHIQNKKDKERQILIASLSNLDDHSAKLIDQLMCLNEKNKNMEAILKTLEQDRIETEEMFSIKQDELEELRKKDILDAMKDMLQAEERQREYEAGRLELAKELQNSTNDSDQKLLDVLCGREQDQQILITKLLEEELYQKEAFEALQMQRDSMHREISYQIKLIEKELSKLTLAELKKKDLKFNIEVNVLAERRATLAQLLTDLLEAKENREEELKKRLQEMEQRRLDEMEDFWLIQYQKLMDRKPQQLIDAELTMDPLVRAIIMDAGANEYLPLFATKQISLSQLLAMTVKDLKKLGILNEFACEAILLKSEEYIHALKKAKGDSIWTDDIESRAFQEVSTPEESPFPSAPEAVPSPTAPLEEEEQEYPYESGPSAPMLSPDVELKLWCQTECVVCLDKQSNAVFLPCGHVCSCWNCASPLTTCPMCRTHIITKFIVTLS